MDINTNNSASLDFSDVLSMINEQEHANMHGEQYDIVSKVAYLLDIHKRIFENESEPPQLAIYKKLEMEKKARIIRNLCRLRTQLEHNFLKVLLNEKSNPPAMLGRIE